MEPKDTDNDQTEKIQTTNDNASLPIKEYEKTTPSEKIPEQLRNPDFRFVKVAKNAKNAIEKAWTTTNNYCYDDKEINNWIDAGGNYGVVSGFGNLVVVDFDNIKIQNEIQIMLPETFMVKTAGKGLHHLYFFVDKPRNNKLFKYDKSIVKNQSDNETLLDIQGPGKYVVGPGSKAFKKDETLGYYEIVHNVPIAKISMGAIEAIIYSGERINQAGTPLFKKKTEERPKKNSDGDDNVQKIKKAVSIKGLLGQFGIDVSKNPTDCPMHNSVGGKCLSFDEEQDVWNCFHCSNAGDVFSLYQEVKGVNFVTALKELAEQNNIQLTTRKSFVKNEGYENLSLEDKKRYLMARVIAGSLDFIELAKEFITEIHPIYYDEARIWWVWNISKCVWEMKDETAIIGLIMKELNYNSIIKPAIKNQLLTAFEVESRFHAPIEPPLNYIQFGRNYTDIDTGKMFPSTPEYFNTNAIPYDMGDSEETPTMDRFFREWMTNEGDTEAIIQKKILKLYEIIAYACYRGYPLARIFCFVGAGANGKSTYLKMIRKFLGAENCANADLDALTDGSNRFATTALFKKLVCTMGETNFGTMRRTNKLKEITGGDLIGMEFKGKNSFNTVNYATIIIATNSLPQTTDKTIGFYRRWDITDFKNLFINEREILDDIPEQEYNNLARKITILLRTILRAGKFSGELTIQQKKEMYEDRSDPLQKFIKEHIDESVNSYIFKWEFEERFGEWCKSNGLRILGKFEISNRIKENYHWDTNKKRYTEFDGTERNVWCWLDVKWRKKQFGEEKNEEKNDEETKVSFQPFQPFQPNPLLLYTPFLRLDTNGTVGTVGTNENLSSKEKLKLGTRSAFQKSVQDIPVYDSGHEKNEKNEDLSQENDELQKNNDVYENSEKNKIIEIIRNGKVNHLDLLDAGISEKMIEKMVKEGDIFVTTPGTYKVLE